MGATVCVYCLQRHASCNNTENAWLCFHDNAFSILLHCWRHTHVKSAKGTHCYVFVTKGIRARATVLRCAYLALLVNFDVQKLHVPVACSEQTWFHMCLLRSTIERNQGSHIETAKEVLLPHFIPFRWSAVLPFVATHARTHTHTHIFGGWY